MAKAIVVDIHRAMEASVDHSRASRNSDDRVLACGEHFSWLCVFLGRQPLPGALFTSILWNEIQMTRAKRQLAITCSVLAALISVACYALARAGHFLVLDRPIRSDLIVVLAEDFSDDRAERAVALLRQGYGKQLVLDAPDEIHYGLSKSDAAADYLQRSAPYAVGRVHVCPITRKSSRREMVQLDDCIRKIEPDATSVVLVTSDYLTRRSLDVAQRVLPRYRWSVAAVREFKLGTLWWRNRESAKVVVTEWQRFMWWITIEQWTADKED